MTETTFWWVILGGAVTLAAWQTIVVSRDSRDYAAWTGLMTNLILAAFASVCLWGLL